MTRATRLFVAAVATVAMLAPVTQAFAAGGGGSNQQCSQRGTKDSSIKCTSIVKTGDVTVTVIGDQFLSKSEVNLVKAAIDVNKTAIEILNDVTVVVVALNDFGEKSVCVQKGLINVCNVL